LRAGVQEKGQFSFLRERIVALARTIVKTSFKGRIYDMVKSWSDDGGNNIDALAWALDALNKTVWPGGELVKPSPIPDAEEQAKARQVSLGLLKKALPPSVARLIGAAHCDKIAEGFQDFLQCPKITRGFVCDVLQVLMLRLFPGDEKLLGANVVKYMAKNG
jgi:hypothetical protein